MIWGVLEKIGLVLGIISSLIEIINLIRKHSFQGVNIYKAIFIESDPDSFLFAFFANLSIMSIISLILLPLGLIFPDFVFWSGINILSLLGMMWICFPLFVLADWAD